MYLYEYVNRCIAIHTYDYDKPEEEHIGMALLRAFGRMLLSQIQENYT